MRFNIFFLWFGLLLIINGDVGDVVDVGDVGDIELQEYMQGEKQYNFEMKIENITVYPQSSTSVIALRDTHYLYFEVKFNNHMQKGFECDVKAEVGPSFTDYDYRNLFHISLKDNNKQIRVNFDRRYSDTEGLQELLNEEIGLIISCGDPLSERRDEVELIILFEKSKLNPDLNKMDTNWEIIPPPINFIKSTDFDFTEYIVFDQNVVDGNKIVGKRFKKNFFINNELQARPVALMKYRNGKYIEEMYGFLKKVDINDQVVNPASKIKIDNSIMKISFSLTQENTQGLKCFAMGGLSDKKAKKERVSHVLYLFPFFASDLWKPFYLLFLQDTAHIENMNEWNEKSLSLNLHCVENSYRTSASLSFSNFENIKSIPVPRSTTTKDWYKLPKGKLEKIDPKNYMYEFSEFIVYTHETFPDHPVLVGKRYALFRGAKLVGVVYYHNGEYIELAFKKTDLYPDSLDEASVSKKLKIGSTIAILFDAASKKVMSKEARFNQNELVDPETFVIESKA